MGADFYGRDLSHIHHHGFGDFARGAAPAIVQRLRAADLAGGRVLDIGCGSGVLACRLVHEGFTVVGIDISPAMVEIARELVPEAEFIIDSVHRMRLPACDAIVALGEALVYEADRPVDLPDFFRRAADALAPGGLLIFDLLLSDPGRQMRYRSSREGPGWIVDVDVSEDVERSVVTRRIQTLRWVDGQARRAQEIHRVRTFARDQIIRWLEAAGFFTETASAYGDQPLADRRLAFFATRSATP